MGTIGIASLASKFESLGMGKEELDVLVQYLKQQPRIVGGADLICAGHSAKHATLLLSGVACSYKRLENGNREIHSFRYAGDFCDLYRYALAERDEAVAVQAITDCVVATIDYAAIDKLLARHPRLGLALWRATMVESSVLRERLSNARKGSAVQRVAHLLCEQLARRDAIGVTSPIMPLTQIDVADATALSIVHVNRTIQTLRSLNALSKTRQVIEVLDRKQLEQIAEFDGRYLNLPEPSMRWAVQIEENARPLKLAQASESTAPRRAPTRLRFAPSRREPRPVSETSSESAEAQATHRPGKAPT
jgi:CRP-like cAMP-binding protein